MGLKSHFQPEGPLSPVAWSNLSRNRVICGSIVFFCLFRVYSCAFAVLLFSSLGWHLSADRVHCWFVLMSFLTADYNYVLPPELIASHPAPVRDQARMMVLDRNKQSVSHHSFREISEFVGPDDLLVLNNTKVIPARIRFRTRKAELLLLEQLDGTKWRCLVRPGHWFKDGRRFSDGPVSGTVLRIEPSGERVIEFDVPIDFARIGEMPSALYPTRY